MTFAIDSTVATLTGSQTLTNKTLTSPDINTPDIDGGTIDNAVIGGSTAAAGSFTTVTATGGSANNTDDANILTLNASQHARLLVDTSSTSGHRATLALESNGNETRLGTTGSASELEVESGDFTVDVAGGITLDADDGGHVRFKDDGTQYASIFKSGSGAIIDTPSGGDITLDSAADIILDADGADVILKDGGTSFLEIDKDGNNVRYKNPISDGDILFQGVDGSSTITALTLDMSNAGKATFTTALSDNTNLQINNTSNDQGSHFTMYNASRSPANDDILGSIDFNGNDSTGTETIFGRIRTGANNVANGSEGGFMSFAIQDSGSLLEHMRVNTAGVVVNEISQAGTDFRVESNDNTHMLFLDSGANSIGINASNPPHPIDITANSSAHGVRIRGRSADDIGEINFQSNDGGTAHSQLQSLSTEWKIRAIANIPISFHTNNTERLRIEEDGNIAISGAGVSVTATDTYHVRIVNTSNQVSQLNYNSNASFTQDLHAWDTIRAGSSAFNFGRWRSNVAGVADSEFIFNGAGTASADGSWNGGGADYAVYFEWADGNSSNEDRVGVSVKLDGTKIVPSTSSDDPSEIIGVISANPSVVGDTAGTKWQSKYEKDDYNRYIYEAYTFTEWTVPATETEEAIHHIYPTDYIPSDVTVPSDAVVISKDEDGNNLMRKKLNSSFDESLTYVPRSDRKEWDTVGLMGKIRMTKGQKTGTNWIKMKDISETVEEWLVR